MCQGHPLRVCEVRDLTPAPFAGGLEIAAKAELGEHLQGCDQLTIDILGYITVAGDGLTLRELCELTDAGQPQLEGRLGGVFGRTLYTRLPTDALPEPLDRVYLFAHETLREIAEQQLAYDVDRYRQRIYDWANKYRDKGWPAGMPRYLLRPYGQLLANLGDVDRLVAIATDPTRHERMLDCRQGTAALAEIDTARQLLLEQARPNRGHLRVLKVHRDRLLHQMMQQMVQLLQEWLRRPPMAREIRIEIDGEVLSIDTTNQDEVDHLITLFEARKKR